MKLRRKIGDKVTIRKDLKPDNNTLYDGIGVDEEMLEYIEGTILDIKNSDYSDTGYTYRLDIDESLWAWTDSMFIDEPVKTRGFEFISLEQGLKDCVKFEEFELSLPKRATKNSAGYDVYAPFEFTLQPNEEIKVPTGLKAYMQNGEMLLFYPRSSLGFKYYCRMANTIPVGDGDYFNNSNNEGHYWIKFRNEGNVPMTIKKGEAMCQAIFQPFLLADNDSFDRGEIREGGIGSTNK